MANANKQVMKNKPFAKQGKSWKALSMVGCLSALSLLAMTGCNKEADMRTSADSGAVGVTVERTPGEAADDKDITSHVKKALSDNTEYKFATVNVATMRGTVQLSGFVDTEAQKRAAGELAKGVPNVKEVVNNITLKQ